jgi:hypothetical protein
MAATPSFSELVEKAVEDFKRALGESVRVEYGVQTEVRDEVYVTPTATEQLAIETVAKYHPSWKAQVVKRTVICAPWAPND